MSTFRIAFILFIAQTFRYDYNFRDGTFECKRGMCGDVNCDEVVDIGDVTLVLTHLPKRLFGKKGN